MQQQQYNPQQQPEQQQHQQPERPRLARYAPQPGRREAAVPVPAEAALLMIDLQNFNCDRRGALYAAAAECGGDGDGASSPELEYWWRRVEECTPRWRALLAAARAARVEVIHTVIQSLTRDGRDRSLDYVISGFHVPPNSWDAQVIAPLGGDALPPDELVLPKTTSSAFASTTLDYLLRNMGKRALLVAGCVTDQCVAHAVKDAADLGYLVTLVEDCCATYTQQRHDAAVAAISGYCRRRSVAQVAEELGGAAAEAARRELLRGLVAGADAAAGAAAADPAAATGGGE